MSKRKPYEVKKGILMLLREKPLSYTQIQTKLSTNYDSVKNNCDELEMYEFVKINKIEKHPENGKPSFDVELTQKGHHIANKFKAKK
jgi:predicted ArsR family transcriptional regulator